MAPGDPAESLNIKFNLIFARLHKMRVVKIT